MTEQQEVQGNSNMSVQDAVNYIENQCVYSVQQLLEKRLECAICLIVAVVATILKCSRVASPLLWSICIAYFIYTDCLYFFCEHSREARYIIASVMLADTIIAYICFYVCLATSINTGIVLTIIICAVISIIAIITVIRLDSTWKERENIQAKSDREKLLVQQQRKIEKMQDKIDYQNIDIIVKNNRIKELKQKNERIEYQLQQCKERLQSTEIQLKAFQSENKQVIVSDNIINAVTEKIASSDVSEPLSDISERDKQIMNCLDAGMSFREVARECNCSVGTISNVRKRLEQATWAGTAR